MSRFSLFLLAGLIVPALPAPGQNRISTPEPAAAAPVMNQAPLPAQKIGVGDVLFVMVYDQKDLTKTVRVDSDGTIELPLLPKPIKAADLMPNQLEAAIAEVLRQEDFVLHPIVSVSMIEYNSRPVTVTGAVRAPATFQAIGHVTLLDAINRAGGLATEAGSEILVIRRPEGSPPLTRRILAKALIDEGDPDVNIELRGGEEVRVPDRGHFYVLGAVHAPGSYPIQEGNDTTILKVLAMCGGLSAVAPTLGYIVRRDDSTGGKLEIPVQIKAIIDRKSADVPLLAADILYIPEKKAKVPLLTPQILVTTALGIATGLTFLLLR